MVGDDTGWVVDVGSEVRPLYHLCKEKRPRAGHDLVDGIAATTQRQPPSFTQLVGQLVEHAADARPYACGGGKMREGVEVVGVAAVLRHEHRRLEAAEQGRHHLFKTFEPWLVPRERRERQVCGRAPARPGAALLHETGAWKQISAVFVKADREHVRVAVKDFLDPVSMVDVDVDVGNTMPSILQPLAGDRRVVVDAKARCATAMRVMQTPRRAERVQRGAALDRLRSHQACAHHHCGPLVQVVGDRVIARAEPRLVHATRGYLVSLVWIAQLSHEVHVCR